MNCRLASLTLVGLVLLSAGLGAQESASSGISGQVVDSTKGAMPGATVTVTNAGTNAQRVVVTDAEGRFTIPNLPPATYSIRVELSGFQTAEIRDLTLRNGEIARPTVALGLASISENVTVVGMSPLLQTTNASVGQTISQKQIEDLPVAGRSLLSFAALSAGVTPQSFARGHAVRRRRQQPQPVRHRRGRARQLHQLRDRRRLRALAALQQPLAQPAARCHPGSQRAPKRVHDRVRPGAGGRVDRDQVRHQPADRFGLRLPPRRRASKPPTSSGRSPASAHKRA